MTVSEFSDKFDEFIDNKIRISWNENNEPIGYRADEYEKSVYLTAAQKQLLVGLYNTYEQTELIRAYLRPLNKSADITIQPNNSDVLNGIYRANLPDDLLWITVEMAQGAAVSSNPCNTGEGKWIEVIPARRDEYLRKRDNPFKNIYV